MNGVAGGNLKRKAVVMLGATYRMLALSMQSFADHSLGMTDVTGDSLRLKGGGGGVGGGVGLEGMWA